jgi:hypothetical protein
MDKEKENRCRELFHLLWGKATDGPEYNKKEWQEFRELLKEKGIVV